MLEAMGKLILPGFSFSLNCAGSSREPPGPLFSMVPCHHPSWGELKKSGSHCLPHCILLANADLLRQE
jgi:hypothetical protein